jgi:hypothetical protein
MRITHMKNLITSLFVLLVTLTNAQIIDIDKPDTYFPTGFDNLKLGIGVQDFHKLWILPKWKEMLHLHLPLSNFQN